MGVQAEAASVQMLHSSRNVAYNTKWTLYNNKILDNGWKYFN